METVNIDNGYIYLDRKIRETSFYKNPIATRLAVHLLLRCNYKDKYINFNGNTILVRRGETIVGRKKLSEETGISEQRIRTSIVLLKNSRFLTIKSTNRFSVITIINYDSYQNKNMLANQDINQQATSKQPAANHKQVKRSKEKEENTETTTTISTDNQSLNQSSIPQSKSTASLPREKNKSLTENLIPETSLKPKPKPIKSISDIPENILIDVNLIVAEYRKIKPGSGGLTDGKVHIAKILISGKPKDFLFNAIKNYGRECRKTDTEEKYRLQINNFFGRRAEYVGFTEDEYAPIIKNNLGDQLSRQLDEIDEKYNLEKADTGS